MPVNTRSRSQLFFVLFHARVPMISKKLNFITSREVPDEDASRVSFHSAFLPSISLY